MKVSEWLAQRDSHNAYGLDLLDQLTEFGVGVELHKELPVVALEANGRKAYIRGQTGAEFVGAIGKVIKGPESAEPGVEGERIIYGGWQLAQALVQLFGKRQSVKMGRGFAFRENLDILREAGY